MKADLWRAFFTTFAAVFVAELGDKTQLATMALAGSADGARTRWVIFLASALALITTSAIGVVAGTAVTRLARPQTIERLAGLLFVVLGAAMLWRSRAG